MCTKSCFTTTLMEKIALNEKIEAEDGKAFFTNLTQLSNSNYTSAAFKKWEDERDIYIPQPALRKDKGMFQIHESNESVKRLGARFDKRCLIIPKIYGTLSDGEYPSVPFGFQSR